MRPLTLACALATALWAAAGSLCGAEVLPASDPAWVQVGPLPAADEKMIAAAVGGRVFLLVDDQFAWDGDTRQHYARRALRVTDRSGLEASARVGWDFAPDFDTLSLTRLQVIRDGKITDLTKDLRPEILRRESRLEAGILDGSLTAHYTIPDLRVGDVLDYSFVMSDRPIVPGATFAGEQGLEYDLPVVLSRLVLNWPKDKPLHLGPVPDRIAHRQEELPGGVTRHEWTRQNHIPFDGEEMTPVEALPDAAVRYSADADWGPLVNALLPLYPDVQVLPPEWMAKVEAIRDANPDDLSRATAALRAVQDEIRYVGIEIGAGGIVPRKPVQVVAQGFGDCKDKSVLLRTMLGALGISAHVALTDLDEGHALSLQQPGISVMDHMIVQARIGDQTYWMDPSGSHEAGRLDHAAVPDYGYALPLAPGVTALQPIVVPPELAWNTQSTEEFDFSPLGVTMTVTSVFRGSAANTQRFRIATEPLDAISRDLFSYYANRYPGLQQLKGVEVSDDTVLNTLTTVEHYVLPAGAMSDNDLWRNFIVASEDFGGYYPRSIAGERKTALSIGQPKMHHHRVLIRKAPVPFLPPQPVLVQNDAFAFSLTGRAERDGDLQLDWDFRTLARLVPADAVAGVIRDARKVSDSTSLSWDISR